VLAYSIALFADKHLELGAALLAFHLYGSSLWALVLTGLVFQVCKVMTALIRVPPSPWSAVLATVAAVALLETAPHALHRFLLGTALFATAVSSLRAWARKTAADRAEGEPGPTVVREAVRAAGFVLAPLFSPLVMGVLVAVAVTAWARAAAPRRPRALRVRCTIVGALAPNHVAMFLHHVHYFAYSHLVPFIFATAFGVPAAWQGFIFYLGWVGYDLHDFVRVSPSWRRVLLGHLVVGAGILTLFWASSAPMAALGWLVTGIGGGTHAMLRRLPRSDDPDPVHNVGIAEDYGHVAGTLVLVSLLAASVPPAGIAVVAAVLAVGSPVLALAYERRPRMARSARLHSGPTVSQT
jgi:hypothetical protein